MSGCGSNTELKSCGGGVRILGVGVSSSSEQRQTKDNLTTLRVGQQTITLRKRKRDFTIKRSNSSTITGSFVCQSTYDSTWYHGRSGQSSTSSTVLSENYVTVDAKIIYMDLRKGIVLYEEETDTMVFNGVPAGSVAFTDSSGLPSSRQVVVVPMLTPYSVVEIDKINAEEKERLTTPYGLDWSRDLHIPLPWSSGMPTANTDIDYLIYDDATRREFGGHDFYYPRWIQPLGVNHADDEYEKDAHLALIDGPEESRSGPGYRGFTPTTVPKGSIAYDKNGNQFYSYKNVLGKGTARLIVQGAEIPIPKDAECDLWFPIAPL